MDRFFSIFVEWYGGIAALSFLFLFIGAKADGPTAFFKSLAWPVVACEYVEICKQTIVENNIDLER